MEKFRDFAIKYLKIAEKDLERAKRNLESGDYEATVFYAQQCVEKSIKSILELHGIFTKEHEISNEFAILAKKERFDENFSRKILTALEFFKLDWSKRGILSFLKARSLLQRNTTERRRHKRL